jgi:hypothetical protein
MMDARPGLFGRGQARVAVQSVLYTVNEEETTMGGILEAVELLKSPVGIIVALVLVGVAVLFFRWVKKD